MSLCPASHPNTAGATWGCRSPLPIHRITEWFGLVLFQEGLQTSFLVPWLPLDHTGVGLGHDSAGAHHTSVMGARVQGGHRHLSEELGLPWGC